MGIIGASIAPTLYKKAAYTSVEDIAVMTHLINSCRKDFPLEELLREDSDSLPSSLVTLDEMTAPGEGALFTRCKVCVNMICSCTKPRMTLQQKNGRTRRPRKVMTDVKIPERMTPCLANKCNMHSGPSVTVDSSFHTPDDPTNMEF